LFKPNPKEGLAICEEAKNGREKCFFSGVIDKHELSDHQVTWGQIETCRLPMLFPTGSKEKHISPVWFA
jgi:hypothetical protein